MNKLVPLAVFALGLCVTPVQANIFWRPYNDHASTAAEGYLNGLGNFYRGAASLVMAKGQYLDVVEKVQKQRIDNWKHAIRSRWEIQDEYEVRRSQRPTFVAREHRRLDMLEERAALEERKRKLIESGVLPEPAESAFFWNGHKFDSYSDFKQSPQYKKFKKEAHARKLMRAVDRQAEIQKVKEAREFLAKWHQMGTSARQSYLIKKSIEETLDEPFEGEPNYKVVKPRK